MNQKMTCLTHIIFYVSVDEIYMKKNPKDKFIIITHHKTVIDVGFTIQEKTIGMEKQKRIEILVKEQESKGDLKGEIKRY